MMPVKLTLPTEAPPYIDTICVYRRVDATSSLLLGKYTLGVSEVTDASGAVNDEYHITFYSSTLGYESLPSNIYRVLTPWRQGMGVVLELQTESPSSAVDSVGIYRRKFQAHNYSRVGLVSVGTAYFYDPDGAPGDEYHTTFIDSVTLAESQPSCSVVADAGSGLVVVTGFDRDIRDTGITQPPGARDPFGAGPRVYIELVKPRGQLTPSVQGGTVVRQNYDVQVQPGGVWSIPLIPNDLYTSPDTFYKFTFTDGEQYFKRISSANGRAQNFSLLEDVDPLELR